MNFLPLGDFQCTNNRLAIPSQRQSLYQPVINSTMASHDSQCFLTSRNTFLLALGCFMLMNVHVVPLAQWRLNHTRTFLDWGNWFTLQAISLRLSSDNRLYSSANWYTTQPLDIGLEQLLNFESGEQQTSTMRRLASGPPRAFMWSGRQGLRHLRKAGDSGFGALLWTFPMTVAK